MPNAGTVRWRWPAALLLAVALVTAPAVPIRVDAANASLVIAALHVLEEQYVDPVDAVPLLNAATAVLRHATGLGADALPDIPAGTSRAHAVSAFTAAFARAAETAAASRTNLAYVATAGMLASLHDSHTFFIDPAALRESRRQLSGRPGFSGIGIGIVGREDSTGTRWVFVDHVFPGSPAAQAGLKRFDKILDTAGKPLKNVSPVEASELLRGPAGSSVGLTIERAGKPIKTSIVRAPIRVPPVEAKFVRPGVAYLEVFEFSRGAGRAARKALEGLAADGPIRSVILDLRSTPGGLIVEAVDVGALFLPPGTSLARIIERGAPPSILRTTASPLVRRAPLAVLVNGGSASGSEIVAGALKAHQRALIVGEKTAGALAGSVIVSLPEGGVSVTVERILLPKSAQVEGIGLSPNLPVDLPVAAMERGEDPQIEAALRALAARVPSNQAR